MAVIVALGLLVAGPAAPASAATFSISGVISYDSPDGPYVLGDVKIFYRNETQTLDPERYVEPNELGQYVIAGLSPGKYFLFLDYSGTGPYLDTWYEEASAVTIPQVNILVSTQDRINRDMELTSPGSISGVVTLGAAGLAPAAGEVLVSYSALIGRAVFGPESTPVPVSEGGAYTLSGLPNGQYRLHYTYAGSGSFHSTWSGISGPKLFASDAHAFAVGGGSARTGRNFVMPDLRTLSGTVYIGSIADPAGAGEVGVEVEYYDGDTFTWHAVASASTTTDASGYYEIPGLLHTGYRVTYSVLTGQPGVAATTVVGNQYLLPAANANVTIPTTYTISGIASLGTTETPAGASDVRVELWRSGQMVYSGLTDASGQFSISGVIGGSATFIYRYLGTGPYRDLVLPTSGSIVIGADSDRSATLRMENWISGTVVDDDGEPLAGVTVDVDGTRAVPVGGLTYIDLTTTTDAEGNYRFTDIPDGDVTVVFSGSTPEYRLAATAWPGKYKTAGDTLHLDGVVRSDIDAEMVEEGTILLSIDAPDLTSNDFHDGYVRFQLYSFDFASGEWIVLRDEPANGAGVVRNYIELLPGFYFIRTTYDGPSWYDSVDSPVITVVPGTDEAYEARLAPVENFECSQVDGHPVSCRIGGEDRFEVSATISQVGFDRGVPVVYVANGLNYPDALSAAPAAAYQGGPLLLVTPSSIPAVILAEIERLEPEKIVVVGGEASVSPAVYAQLSGLAGDITRLGGSDRFAASRAVADYAFMEDGSTVAYIATGLGFPDALSAGGAAAEWSAPVITVNGLASSVDAATKALLVDLGVTEVRIAGGPGSVTEALKASIDAIPGVSVTRLSGQDRYEASGAINRAAFGSASVVFLAVGTNYPDALSGGALAGVFGAPIYVIPATCIPSYVLDDIDAFGATSVVVLGGPASVADSVLDFAECHR